MHILTPLPRAVTRPLTWMVLVAWVVTMATLVARSYGQSSQTNLATDLARYGTTAVWRGVYYRGEKIGFTVSQTTRTDDGFELQVIVELSRTQASRPVEFEHGHMGLHQGDEGKKQRAVQAAFVEPVGRGVRGRDHDGAVLE